MTSLAAGTVAAPNADQAATRLVVALEVAEGTLLARRGRYSEADAALTLSRSTPGGLDLRARIAAQQRRYEEAERLWREAADRLGAPGTFAEEHAALTRLRGRRFALAPFVVAALVLGSGLVGWAVGRRPEPSRDELAQLRADLDGLVAVPDEQLDGLAADEGTDTVEVPALPESFEQQLRDIDGVVVERGEGSLELAFGAPVFSELTTLTPEGETTLAEVADVVTAYAVSSIIVVTGHTDSVPLRTGGQFASNEELAIARAQAGVTELVAAGLAADRVTVSLADAPTPPLAGDDGTVPENRTLTLVVHPVVS